MWHRRSPLIARHLGQARRHRDGFTLVELLIVFALIGIVSAISIRSVGDTIRRDRVQKALAIVSTDIEAAFAMAARQRAPVLLQFDSTRRLFTIALRSDTTLRFRRRSFAIGDLALDYISASSPTVVVLPSGLSADTLSLRLGIYSRNGVRYDRTVRMTRGGLVRIK